MRLTLVLVGVGVVVVSQSGPVRDEEAPPGSELQARAEAVESELHEAEDLSRQIQYDIGAGDWSAAEASIQRLVVLKDMIDNAGPWGASAGMLDHAVDSLQVRAARRDNIAAQ